jgi:hypothetical protein
MTVELGRGKLKTETLMIDHMVWKAQRFINVQITKEVFTVHTHTYTHTHTYIYTLIHIYCQVAK